MQMLPTSDCVCSGKQLGEVLGMNLRQIERHAQSGVLKPVRCKLRGKHFRLNESVQAYQAYREQCIKKACASSDRGYNAARTSRMLALATIETLRAKQLRGKLLDGERVDIEVTMILRNLRDNLRGLPAQLMRPLQAIDDPVLINKTLKEAIDRVLHKTADGGISARLRRREAQVESTNGEEQAVE